MVCRGEIVCGVVYVEYAVCRGVRAVLYRKIEGRAALEVTACEYKVTVGVVGCGKGYVVALIASVGNVHARNLVCGQANQGFGFYSSACLGGDECKGASGRACIVVYSVV